MSGRVCQANLLDAALELTAAGWAVHPLKGKTAVTAHGFKDATTDPGQVREWWQRWPSANVGVAVPGGMVVVDVDPRHGGEVSLGKLASAHGPLPRTLTTLTGSGGRHLWFAAATAQLEQRALAGGVDTRVGGKGYVLAPPSIHPETRQPYQWAQPLAPVAWLPSWVADRLRKRPPTRTYGGTVAGGYGPTGEAGWLLKWAAERVRLASEGSRHDTLRCTARLLGGYVATGVISESDARDTLRSACEGWGTQRKDHQTIESAIEHGRSAPLEVS